MDRILNIITPKRDKTYATLIKMITVRKAYKESQSVTRFLFRLHLIYIIVVD